MSKLFLIFFICAFSAIFLISGCLKEKAAKPVGNCDTNKLYFQQDVLPIFISNCAMSGCHDGGTNSEGFNFTYYSGIASEVKAGKPLDSKIYEAITKKGKDKMPPSGYSDLSTKQIQTIYDWIAQGALNEVCIQSNCDTSTLISYTSVVEPIIQNNCMGCHNTANTSGGINLSTYQNVVSSVTNGGLMGTINHLSGYNAMPKGGTILSSCDRSKIQKWINDGYLNN
jgi:cytochrome c5